MKITAGALRRIIREELLREAAGGGPITLNSAELEIKFYDSEGFSAVVSVNGQLGGKDFSADVELGGMHPPTDPEDLVERMSGTIYSKVWDVMDEDEVDAFLEPFEGDEDPAWREALTNAFQGKMEPVMQELQKLADEGPGEF
jgi:hypothetical protein